VSARSIRRREGDHHSEAILYQHEPPAQRQAEVLGTLVHAQLPVWYKKQPIYAPLLGIGSGHRQLIAVTCIAEHA